MPSLDIFGFFFFFVIISCKSNKMSIFPSILYLIFYRNKRIGHIARADTATLTVS